MPKHISEYDPLTVNTTVHTTTVKTCRIIITVEMLLERFGLPLDAEVNVGIPGGGDYSNMTLELGDLADGGIMVVWNHTYEKLV